MRQQKTLLWDQVQNRRSGKKSDVTDNICGHCRDRNRKQNLLGRARRRTPC